MPKSRLIFGVATYNSEKTLPKCLNSIKPHADRIIVVDGRFRGRSGLTVGSWDHTRQIALLEGCEVIQSGGLPQHKQRDLYLLGRPGDFYFIIDSDEFFEGRFDKEAILSARHNCYALWIRNPLGFYPSATMTLRIYRHIGQKPSHNEGQLLKDGYGQLMDATYPGYTFTDDFWLQHLKH